MTFFLIIDFIQIDNFSQPRKNFFIIHKLGYIKNKDNLDNS